MRLKPTLYTVHRWLALVIAVQLLAWSLGGLTFSLLDIEEVRGNTDARAIDRRPVACPDLSGLPKIVAAHPDFTALDLRSQEGRCLVEARGPSGQTVARFDPATGAPLPPVNREEAIAIAERDFVPGAKAISAAFVDRDPPLEYRGKPTPAWRVKLDHPSEPHIYVSAVTGTITARRNSKWRLFDFFWMLHIMDYSEREDFNHPLLTFASLLAVLTSLSGVVLWWWRLPLRRKARATQ